MRNQLPLIAMLAADATAQTSPQAVCVAPSVDASQWLPQRSTAFGTRFLEPPRYRRTIWERRGSSMP